MHVYIHVPFCARRCSYCDFSIAVRRVTPDNAFVRCILREWRSREVIVASGGPIATVYFGGGTPSRLDPASIERILDGIRETVPVAEDVEVTLEANPDDVDEARVQAWRAAGINRASLGVQSHDSSVLEWMHRTHRAEQVEPAMAMLRGGGLTNISVDLIFALPRQLARDWQRDVDLTLAMQPSHVSLYGLTLEPHTPLAHWHARGTAALADDDSYAAEYLAAHDALIAAGYCHYEVSNASLPGLQSRHNSAYWSGADYVGLGPSAHSLSGTMRYWNVRDWVAYQQACEAGHDVEGGRELLDDAGRAIERRYLGLRTREGVPAATLAPSTVRAWCAAGWATVVHGIVKLTPEGWLRLDALVIASPES